MRPCDDHDPLQVPLHCLGRLMGLELCKKCGRMHYQTDPCATAPKRVAIIAHHQSGKSLALAAAALAGAAAANVVVAHDDRVRDLPPESLPKIAEAQAKAGRPRIHPDRKAYKAAKEREYRKRRAAQKTTPSTQTGD